MSPHQSAARRIAILLSAAAFLTANSAPAAQLKGVVVSDSGKAVANARVGVHKNTAKGPISVAAPLGAGTDKKGAFVVDGLEVADYEVCVDAPGTDFLDTCKWGIALPLVSVTSAQAVIDYKAVLTHGATIDIRVDDPEELIHDPAKPGDNHLLVVDIWTPHHTPRHAALLSSDRQGHDYEVIIPPDTDLQFSFFLINLQLVDKKGNLLDPKAIWDLHAKAGSAQKFEFRIMSPRK
jgi:hypothetical protein